MSIAAYHYDLSWVELPEDRNKEPGEGLSDLLPEFCDDENAIMTKELLRLLSSKAFYFNYNKIVLLPTKCEKV